jgi:hypothetical protein
MPAMSVTISEELESAISAYRTCEFLTVSRDGTPIAWPTISVQQPDGTFLISTSIGLPQKAFNVRRNPAVALLFSDPTASGLVGAPAVLVQGTASCPDEIVTSVLRARELWLRIFDRQPSSRSNSSNAISRRLMDFYYMRLLITITPTAIHTVPALPVTSPLEGSGSKGRGEKDPFALAVRRLPEFDSAVLTAFDEQGNPTLLRVRPSAEPANRLFHIDTDAPLRPGRASLLCHSHDEQLWNLRSFVVAGELSRRGENWTLRPDRFIPGGADKLGPIGMVKIIRELRGTARRYLQRRGLPRPDICWQDIDALIGELGPTA